MPRSTTTGLIALLVLLGAGARAQQTPASDSSASIIGRVIGPTNAPVTAVTIEAVGVGLTYSDSAGDFRLPGLPRGSLIIRATKIGFRPVLKVVTIVSGEPLYLAIALDESAHELGPVVVRGDSTITVLGDPSGFESRRRKATGGLYILAADIDRKHVIETEQIFHGIPAVQVDTGGIVVIKRGETSLRDLYLTGKNVNQFNMCIGAQVLVDGVHMPQPFNINQISLSSIRGIEIYQGPATTPPALRSPKTICGTVAIWTK